METPLTEVGRDKLLARHDKHQETDWEEECCKKRNQGRVVGSQSARATLDELHKHGSETELAISPE